MELNPKVNDGQLFIRRSLSPCGLSGAWPRVRLHCWTWVATALCAASSLDPIGAQELPAPFQVMVVATDVSASAPRMEEVESDEFSELQLTPLPGKTSLPVVTALAASHDGHFMAAAGDDHAVRIINVANGQTINTLLGHTDWIQALVFSADSRKLFSAGNDGRVLMWDEQYPPRFEQVLQVDFAIRAVTLSSERNLLAVSGFADTVLILDLSTAEIKHRLQCDSHDQRCVRFSPDGSRLLRAGRMGQICVWDTQSGQELAHYREHQRRVFTAAFSADNNQITSVGEDRRLVRFDITAGQRVFEAEVGQGKLMSMCMINDTMVAAAGADNSIVLIDMLTGRKVHELRGHTGTVAVMVPCGDKLASGSFDTTIRLWNLERIGRRSSGLDGRPVNLQMKVDRSLNIR